MINWTVVAEVAGGGFGTTILVLIILSLAIWIVGLVVKKTTKTIPVSKESPGKEK